MICLFEGVTLESLCNLRIPLAIGLTSHGQIHSDLTAFTVAYGNYTGAAPTFGIVSADKKTITIPLPQKTKGDLSAFGFDNVWMMAHEGYGGGAGVYITDGTNIVFTQGADGTWSTTQSFGAGHPDDLAEWPKLFTDYCVNYADVSAANPICFVKK